MGVNLYEVSGYPGSYLLELLTQSDDTLWLFVHNDTSREGLDMVKLSMDVMRKPRKTPMSRDPYGFGRGESPTFAGAKVPMIEFDIKPDLSWLLGADTTTVSGDYYFIAQAAHSHLTSRLRGAREKIGATIDHIAAPFALSPCCIASKSQFGRLYGHGDLPAGRSQ